MSGQELSASHLGHFTFGERAIHTHSSFHSGIHSLCDMLQMDSLKFRVCRGRLIFADRNHTQDTEREGAIIVKMTNRMQLYRLIYYSKSTLHVSGDIFVYNQEHLTVFTVFDSVHPSCCRLPAENIARNM
jgi:hypothetical protein